jgi:hypothetical protein
MEILRGRLLVSVEDDGSEHIEREGTPTILFALGALTDELTRVASLTFHILNVRIAHTPGPSHAN